MTTEGPPSGAHLARRSFLRSDRRVPLAVLLLLIAVRVALPSVVRRVVVDRADRALVGRVEIDDVDLALLTGVFTLHGLRVYADEAAPAVPTTDASPTTPPRAGEGRPGSAPVLSARRLTVDLGFLALLRKTIDVQRIELEDVAVSLDRGADGTLLLPAAVTTAEPEPEPADTGPGWG